MIIECVICYEHLQSAEAIYHTPCGHVFHYSCLTQWFKRSETCPECRQNIAEKKISRLYLNFANNDPGIEEAINSSLQTQISGLNHELLIKELEIIESNSNNTKLSALLKSRESDIIRLQSSIRITQDENKVWKTIMETQKREMDALKRDIARISKERDDVMSSNRSWEKVSQMFHGITDHNALIEMISVMKKELATCTNTRWELQRTVMRLQQELTEATEARMYSASERTKKCEIESDVALSEIEKFILRHRIEDLEDMVEPDLEANNLLSHKSLQEFTVSTCNPIPYKKRKLDVADKLSGIAGGPSTPIDVIDLTVEPVQPLIDLTKDTAELSSTPVPFPTCWPLSTSLES